MSDNLSQPSQNTAARRFCVLTVGRSGSTSLMSFLSKFPDIALPCRDIDCYSNELFHPVHWAQYVREYEKIGNLSLQTRDDLIKFYYDYHASSAYAGFKSMPKSHLDSPDFFMRKDIQFITLVREDIASTVASFMLAMMVGSWRRTGGLPPTRWQFVQARDSRHVLSNLAYVLKSKMILRRIPSAIALTYEELCDPAFSNAGLNQFFARQVKIDNPQPPTHGSSYVENWEEFDRFIKKMRAQIIL